MQELAKRSGRPAGLVLYFAVAAAVPGGAAAQATAPDWSWKGELTSVATSGNAEAFTFGVGSSLERKGVNTFKFETGWMRTESVIVERHALGNEQSFEIVREEQHEKTAEAYYARSRYDVALGGRYFFHAGADWMRNTFAGVASRTVLVAGAGTTWADNQSVRFRTNVGGTWNFQRDVVDNPRVANSFAGARAGWELWTKVSATTEFESRLVGDLSLDDTEDAKADFTNSLAVAINSALALKPSLQVLWRNLPAVKEVPLFNEGGLPTDKRVLAPLEKTDLLFRLALVVKL